MIRERARPLEPGELILKLRKGLQQAMEAGLIDQCQVRGKTIFLRTGQTEYVLTPRQATWYLEGALWAYKSAITVGRQRPPK